MENLALLAQDSFYILSALASLVITVATPIIAWKASGHFNLSKTYEAAEDAIAIVQDLIQSGKVQSLKEASEAAIVLVEDIRKKRLSKKLKGKVAARVKGAFAEIFSQKEDLESDSE